MSLGHLARRLPAIISLLVSGASLASAACECGYTSTIQAGPDKGSEIIFTDLIESDFVHVANVSHNTDWAPQAFTIEKANARGKYGEMFTHQNVVTNPITNNAKYSGPGADGGDPGLTLTVGSRIEGDLVPAAEVTSMRLDILYGTFRAGIKLPEVAGTCAAFFWYFNDTQEIDMEFLTKEFNFDNDTYPVNLVLQSREAAENGFDASSTNHFVRANLPFNPTTAFHEYRVDFFQDQVSFFADGAVLATMNGSAVPTSPGRLLLTHWSNGNPLWSGGPPEKDAVMAVSYVKAYFNSSEPQRHADWENRCQDVNAQDATCAIPDVTADNDDAATFFFSQQENMAPNQTISGVDNAGGRSTAPLSLVIASSVLFTTGCLMGVW